MIRGIVFTCDTDGCGSRLEVSAPDVESAVQRAAERYGWSSVDGEDFCRSCPKEN